MFRVHIQAKEKYALCTNLKRVIGLSKHERGAGQTAYVPGQFPSYFYITHYESLAMSVYTKAKRNLDASKWSVALELPEKGREK